MESDVQIGHGDQTRHSDVRGEARDQNGLQVVSVGSPEEGLLGVWMQRETGGAVNG